MKSSIPEIMANVRVQIYTSPFCGYCIRAKSLLDDKGVDYEEFGVMMDRGLHSEMLNRSNGKTSVPQIFINDEHIGGCDELYALDREQALDAKLGLV